MSRSLGFFENERNFSDTVDVLTRVVSLWRLWFGCREILQGRQYFFNACYNIASSVANGFFYREDL